MKTAVKLSVMRYDAKHKYTKTLNITYSSRLQDIETTQRLRKYRTVTTVKLRQVL